MQTKKKDMDRQLKEVWRKVFPLRRKAIIVQAVATFCVGMAVAYLYGEGIHSLGDFVTYLFTGFLLVLWAILLVFGSFVFIVRDESVSNRTDEILIAVCFTLTLVSLVLLFSKYKGMF